MLAEYSYFRAAGAALEAVKTVYASRAEMQALKTELAARYGAAEFGGSFNRDAKTFTPEYFRFEVPNKTAPEGWVAAANFVGGDPGEYMMPSKGSADSFNVAEVAGRIARAAARAQLEDVLATGPMPMREMFKGETVTQTFVRYTMADKKDAKPAGKIRDVHGYMAFGDSWEMSDPLTAFQMGGNVYLRVPNKAGTETPVFIPKDAVQVSYDDMLAVDAKEYVLRQSRTAARSSP